MRPRSRRRAGLIHRAAFTLLEVMVALTVIAFIFVGARLLVVRVADDADRLRAMQAQADGVANGERVLQVLFDQLEVATDTTRTFEGDEQTTQFTTWCEVPAGWTEQCTAVVTIGVLGGEPVIAATLSTGEQLVLRRGFARGELRYLRDAAVGGAWVHRWGRSLSAPLAVGLLLDGDTVIVRIGERG